MRTLNQADLPYRPQFGPHITSCTARAYYTPESNPMSVIVTAIILFFVFCLAVFVCIPVSGWLLEASDLAPRHPSGSVSDWVAVLAAFGMTVALACYLQRFRARLHDSVPLELFEGGIHLTTKLRCRTSRSGAASQLVNAERWVTRSWRLLDSVRLVEPKGALGKYLELEFTDGERVEVHQSDGDGCDTVIETLASNFIAISDPA